jgi:MoxR-like ATPase
VQALFPVLNHRLILSAEKEMDGFDVKEVLDELIKQVDVPR